MGLKTSSRFSVDLEDSSRFSGAAQPGHNRLSLPIYQIYLSQVSAAPLKLPKNDQIEKIDVIELITNLSVHEKLYLLQI